MNSFYSLIILVTAILASALAGYADYNNQDFYTVPKYAYKYGVQDKATGDYKQAYEVREGDITRGAYSFLQPDGILRTVKYTVDPKGGFRATVINSGQGHHPKVYHHGYAYTN